MGEYANFSATQPKADTTGRSQWHRPRLRKSDAREAELNPASTTDNAVFS